MRIHWTIVALGAVAVLASAGCDVGGTEPTGVGLEAPTAAAKPDAPLGMVETYEDRLQHARYYRDLGVIRQCQANPLEDADGNDWKRTSAKDGSSHSKMVESEGVALARQFTVGPADFDGAGNLIVPRYDDDRWIPTHVGRVHITINLWRDALETPLAISSNVQGFVAPLGPDDAWIGMLDEPGDEVGGAHDLRNETFTPGSPILADFDREVAEANAAGTLEKLSCDQHLWYTDGRPSWVQRNDVILSGSKGGVGRGRVK